VTSLLFGKTLIDTNCVLQGQNVTLYTAIGQPFNAKLAVVDLDFWCLTPLSAIFQLYHGDLWI